VAFFGRFFGRAGSEAAGIALGASAVPALLPAAQFIVNEAWKLHPDKPPDAYVVAVGVAQGQVDHDSAVEWAHEQGLSDGAFGALVDAANIGPALGQAYSAWRRGELSDGQMRTAIKRQGIEDVWVPALMALKQEPLDPSTIANAVHRGIMRDASLIVREPPTTAGKVEQVPPSPLDPVEEAAWSGINHERLRVEVGTTGLPPGLVQMLQLLNRGEVTVADVQRAVSQSNLRNEYMDVVLALRRRLLTPHEYEEGALRGIKTRAEADAGAALSGMEKEDAQFLFELIGRPLVVHQITTGLARGAKLGGTYADVPEPYRDAIRRSNIRPEYAGLAYANRYSYPSAFVLRSLAQSGELGDAAAVQKILEEIGWPPTLAAKVAPAWVGGTTGADAHVGKAQTQLWGTLHRSYIAGESTKTEARPVLASLGLTAASQTQVFVLWDAERALVRKQLTPAQVKKAYTKGIKNQATGATWTRDDALAALIERGYATTEANEFLDL
jgi:hypothetical protein